MLNAKTALDCGPARMDKTGSFSVYLIPMTFIEELIIP